MSPHHSVIDLHMHSTASDGHLTPAELVTEANRLGVRTMALTDHDTVAGLPQAAETCEKLGLTLIPGTEISCVWEGKELHLIALGITPDEPGLARFLADQNARRADRAQRIAERLRRLGLPDLLPAARRAAGGGQISRPHFAAALVELGCCPSRAEAFRRLLRAGKPGHVRTEWPTMEQTVETVHAAGGVAVLAHPLAYQLTLAWLRRILTAFVENGGEGIEVVSGPATENDVRSAAALARRFGLYASTGSDFHDPASPWIRPGAMAPLPATLPPIWDHPRIAHRFNRSPAPA